MNGSDKITVQVLTGAPRTGCAPASSLLNAAARTFLVANTGGQFDLAAMPEPQHLMVLPRLLGADS